MFFGRAYLLAICVVSTLLTTGCQYLQSADPTEEELREQLAIDLPAYWRASAFQLEATQRTGSDQFRGRFKANIELVAPTFAEERRVGDVVFVRQTGRAGERKAVFGRVQARRSRGGWVSELRLENAPTATAGLPREFIRAPRVIVVGSAEERDFWAQQERMEAEARQAEEAERLAARQRLEDQLVGEWHGSMFTETDSRLVIERKAWGLVGWLFHQGYRETLRVEVLAENRLLLTGIAAERLDGKRSTYNLDTFDLEISPEGGLLFGAARDRGGAAGSVSMRKVT